MFMAQQALKRRDLPSNALLTNPKKSGILLTMVQKALKGQNLFLTFFCQ
jgi:hypothetical protein